MMQLIGSKSQKSFFLFCFQRFQCKSTFINMIEIKRL